MTFCGTPTHKDRRWRCSSVWKLHRLQGDELHRVMLDNDEPNRLAGERPALFHILKMRKRQEARMIRSIQDECGNNQQTMKGIIRAFTSFLRRKYEPIAVNEDCVAYMAELGQLTLPTAWRDLLEQYFSLEEAHITVRKGGKNKVQGSDGIGLEFYKANLAMNQDDIGLWGTKFSWREKCPLNRSTLWSCACPSQVIRPHPRTVGPLPYWTRITK